MKNYWLTFASLVLCAGLSSTVAADQWPLPENGDDVIGEGFTVHARGEDTLLDIARRYGLGYQEITNANPEVDVWLPGDSTLVNIPRRFILPDAPREGIVLNIPEMRLYYFTPSETRGVVTHPVSIGRMDWKTPLGVTEIVAKVRNPAWYPPETIRAEHAARGDYLPQVIAPGPENPLGGYAMRLGIPGYLIHGTNKPAGVGMRVTHGCIRMYPEDIVAMFDDVPEGTQVRLVNQPIKVGWLQGRLYLEVHPPLEESRLTAARLLDIAYREVQKAIGTRSVSVRTQAIKQAVRRQSGVPQVVARTDTFNQLQARDTQRTTQ